MAQHRAGVARPARHPCAGGFGLFRPRRSATRRLCEALYRRSGVRAAAVFLSAHRSGRFSPLSHGAGSVHRRRIVGYGGCAVAGLRETMPALYTILILQIAITPITSSAAFAALMGLDVAFALAALIVCNAISPITTVAFSYLFLGSSLFSPLELGIKLFFFFAASGAIAYAIRRIAGPSWIERQKDAIDGLNVIAVFVFAIAAMESVPRNVMADPLFALELFVFVIVGSCALIGLSVLVFPVSYTHLRAHETD